MSNFGFTELRLVKPYDVAFREARSAVRAHYILEQTQVFESLEEATADCSLVAGSTAVGRRDLHVPLYRLETASDLLREAVKAAPAAILFGSEKFGLSNEHLSHCHWIFRIPSREEHGSINLGQAVAITLYELRRDSTGVRQTFTPSPHWSIAEAERANALLADILRRAGYTQERTSISSEQKLRRLLRRSRLPSGDAETWLGILRQILWKLKQGDNS